MLKTVFWQRAAQSLPPAVRARYQADLERAERIDLLVAALIDACSAVRAALRRRIAPVTRL
jgi:hypothetical protein